MIIAKQIIAKHCAKISTVLPEDKLQFTGNKITFFRSIGLTLVYQSIFGMEFSYILYVNINEIY